MSQPLSRLLHRFEPARHPTFEPEVVRAILESRAFAMTGGGGRPRRKLRKARAGTEEGWIVQ